MAIWVHHSIFRAFWTLGPVCKTYTKLNLTNLTQNVCSVDSLHILPQQLYCSAKQLLKLNSKSLRRPWRDYTLDFNSYCSIIQKNNWPNSQIPECTCSISHNAPFRTEMCIFLFWMVHCGIWKRCILGFVKLVYWIKITLHSRLL